MSDAGKTLSIIYTILETGTRLRREVFSNRDAYLVESDYQIRTILVAAAQTVTLTDIVGFFFLTAEAPIQVKLNNSNYITVQKTLSIFAPLDTVVIHNPGTTAINCKLIHS